MEDTQVRHLCSSEIADALDMRELLLGGFRCIVTDNLETLLCLKLTQRLFGYEQTSQQICIKYLLRARVYTNLHRRLAQLVSYGSACLSGCY